jgi:hypothetical protein
LGLLRIATNLSRHQGGHVPHMICRTVEPAGYAGIRPLFVSVPLVPQLLDGKNGCCRLT